MKYTIIALLVLFVSFATAQQGMRGKAHARAGGGDWGAVGKLKLTDDQQKQFDKLSSDLQKTQIAVRSKIQTAHVDLHDLMKEDSPDRAKFLAKQAEINKLEGELKQNRTGFWFERQQDPDSGTAEGLEETFEHANAGKAWSRHSAYQGLAAGTRFWRSPSTARQA